MSTWCVEVSSRDSRVAASVTKTATIATGTLRKKIDCQETFSTRNPPTTGPIASAIALTPAHVPIALPRSCGGKALEMIDSVAGIMNAAPTPCAARPATSQASLCEKPMNALDRPNDDDAEQEHLAAAEDVAEAAARHEEDGEGEGVGVDGPLEAGDRAAQVLLDRGERDVHDRVVEHDHEQREAHRAEGPPAAVVVGDGGADSCHGRWGRSESAAIRRVRCSGVREEVNCSRPSSRASRMRRATSRPAGVMPMRFMRRSASSSRRSR